MTGWERLGNYLEEVWWMIKPTDLTSTISFIAIIAIFVIAIFGRKVFGGFWKGLFKMFVFLLIIFILNSISTYLLLGVLGFALFAYVFRKHMRYFCIGIMVATIVATVGFLFWYIGVWRKSGSFFTRKNVEKLKNIRYL